jgi:hypothetical protein
MLPSNNYLLTEKKGTNKFILIIIYWQRKKEHKNYAFNQHNTMINEFIYEVVTSNFEMIYRRQCDFVPWKKGPWGIELWS